MVKLFLVPLSPFQSCDLLEIPGWNKESGLWGLLRKHKEFLFMLWWTLDPRWPGPGCWSPDSKWTIRTESLWGRDTSLGISTLPRTIPLPAPWPTKHQVIVKTHILVFLQMLTKHYFQQHHLWRLLRMLIPGCPPQTHLPLRDLGLCIVIHITNNTCGTKIWLTADLGEKLRIIDPYLLFDRKVQVSRGK